MAVILLLKNRFPHYSEDFFLEISKGICECDQQQHTNISNMLKGIYTEKDFNMVYEAMGRYKWGHLIAYYTLVESFTSLRSLQLAEVEPLLSFTFFYLSIVEENWIKPKKKEENYFVLSAIILPWMLLSRLF